MDTMLAKIMHPAIITIAIIVITGTIQAVQMIKCILANIVTDTRLVIKLGHRSNNLKAKPKADPMCM